MKWCITLQVLFFAWITAEAQIFVKHNAIGNIDGSSWADAYIDLQNALEVAGPGDQIWVAAGTYIPNGFTPQDRHFIALNKVEIYGGFAGTESNLNERDWNANLTILSGDVNGDDVPENFVTNRSDNAHHIFILNAGVVESVIDGLHFRGGSTRTDTYNEGAADTLYNRWRGGALYIRRSDVLVNNCTFTDNYGYQGSGLYGTARFSSGVNVVTIANTIFKSNGSSTSGACYLSDFADVEIQGCIFQLNESDNFGAGLVLGNTNSTVIDCMFDSNYTLGTGAAFYSFQNSFSIIPKPEMVFRNTVFSNNTADSYAGAMRIQNLVKGFSLTIDSCSFMQNAAISGWGGAIDVEDYRDTGANVTEDINITNSTFTSNSAVFGGGVMIVTLDDSLNIRLFNNQFLSNSGVNGGAGLYVYQSATAVIDLALEHTLFDGNSAGFSGALGIENTDNSYPMQYRIDGCSFTNNTTDGIGGAIRTYGSFVVSSPFGTIRNSNFSNNQSGEFGGAIFSVSETLSIENCLFENNYTQGNDPDFTNTGGGAVGIAGYDIAPGTAIITNSIFKGNTSDTDGGAVWVGASSSAELENILFQENIGNSSLFNAGTIRLTNATLVDNEYGLGMADSSYSHIQNSIFNNFGANLITVASATIESRGGNISSDATMSTPLIGYGSFEDLHNTDPLLGLDFVPLAGSPAIDAGNLDNISLSTDLAGNPRIQGGGIDIGSYESFLVATYDAQWNAPSFTVYPNPVKDVLHFELDIDWIGDVNMTIFNYSGQPVHRALMVKADSKQAFSENLRQLPPGEYVVLAIIGETTFATNVIIQP